MNIEARAGSLHASRQTSAVMTILTIRKLPNQVHDRLRQRAARHGVSTEEEVRQILSNAVAEPIVPGSGLVAKIHAQFAMLGGIPEVAARRSKRGIARVGS